MPKGYPKKTAQVEDVGPRCLSTLDLMAMKLNNAQAIEAKLRMELAAQKFAHAAMMGELNATRLEAQTNRNLATAKAQEDAAKEEFKATAEQSRILAEDLGKRYHVDWRSASFDPLTGAITELPKEPSL